MTTDKKRINCNKIKVDMGTHQNILSLVMLSSYKGRPHRPASQIHMHYTFLSIQAHTINFANYPAPQAPRYPLSVRRMHIFSEPDEGNPLVHARNICMHGDADMHAAGTCFGFGQSLNSQGWNRIASSLVLKLQVSPLTHATVHLNGVCILSYIYVHPGQG